jgi:hypothetical protein
LPTPLRGRWHATVRVLVDIEEASVEPLGAPVDTLVSTAGQVTHTQNVEPA